MSVLRVIPSTKLYIVALLAIGLLPAALAEDDSDSEKEECEACDRRLKVAIGVAIGVSTLLVIVLLAAVMFWVRRRRQQPTDDEPPITFEIEPSQIAGPPPSIPTTYNPAYDPAVPGNKSDRIRANLNKSPGGSSSSKKPKYTFPGYSNKNPPPVPQVTVAPPATARI